MAQKHNLTIQAVSIIGGILTAIFFLGFLALARILRSDISCLIVGSILILTTLTISRMVIRSFLDAMNITLYIAGCVLIGFGIMPALISSSLHLWESVFSHSCYQEGLSSPFFQSFCLIYLSSEKPPMSFLRFIPCK